MSRTLTAANSVLFLAVTGLFNVPVQIQGFAADDVFDTDAVQPAETQMGVDGRLSAGFTPAAIIQNITVQADSVSIEFFELWYQAMQFQREVFFASGTIALPSVQRKYALTRGVLTGVPPTPSAKKIIQPRRFSITWERVTNAPFI